MDDGPHPSADHAIMERCPGTSDESASDELNSTSSEPHTINHSMNHSIDPTINHRSIWPHGLPGVTVVIISILAFILSYNVAYGCFYVVARNPFDRFPDFDGNIGLGLWTREDIHRDGYQCIMYSEEYLDDSLDGFYSAARVFGFASVVTFAVVSILLILLACFSYHPHNFYYIGAFALAGSLFQCLTFLIYLASVCEDDKCDFSVGSGLAIAATAVGFLNAVLLFNMPLIDPPKPEVVANGAATGAYNSSGNSGNNISNGNTGNNSGIRPPSNRTDQYEDEEIVMGAYAN